MRYLWAIFFSIGALAVVAQTPLKQEQPAENKQVQLAKQELQRISTLVDAGAYYVVAKPFVSKGYLTGSYTLITQ